VFPNNEYGVRLLELRQRGLHLVRRRVDSISSHEKEVSLYFSIRTPKEKDVEFQVPSNFVTIFVPKSKYFCLFISPTRGHRVCCCFLQEWPDFVQHICPTKEKGKYVEFFVKRSKYSISKRRRSRPVCQNDII
jgi:hypothetical protein